jgi:hypothetical protein
MQPSESEKGAAIQAFDRMGAGSMTNVSIASRRTSMAVIQTQLSWNRETDTV